ncbi:peroxiredoxin [Sphingomonas nostoxanthinifaciens]|uniref:peroxiredoxin n=1 Tax=Sphingomonas nostoxanthinifaciens TaxID=2872652 RepID=UPI001CC1FC97|nr:peroxiredoxin [Sphingomonas nostoxanthinifaciens]
MRGLTIIVAGDDPQRFGTALAMAAAHAALGGSTNLFADGAAVVLLAGLTEDRRALIDTALELGVRILACQTGLADTGLAFAALDPRIEAGGLVGVLAAIGDDRLVVV